jgi:hypothetical protein
MDNFLHVLSLFLPLFFVFQPKISYHVIRPLALLQITIIFEIDNLGLCRPFIINYH